MGLEIVEVLEAEWGFKPSRKRLVWLFFFVFEHPLPGNFNAKLAII